MTHHLVFVYGTLMKHEANHHYLRQATRLGPARTAPCFRLFSLGSYPVLCLHGHQRVRGEVYRVSTATLRRLDRLEEYPHYYQRKRIPTRYGKAWLYFHVQPPAGARPIASGNWKSVHGRFLDRFEGCPADGWDSRE